jgi:PBP1b-binding outer membrane lipoprotein LpoB
MRKIAMIMLTTILLSSCLKELDPKIIEDANIKVTWHSTSSITTIHDHVKVSNGWWSKEVFEIEGENLQSVEINAKQIVAKIRRRTNNIYKYEKEAFGYEFVLDSTLFKRQ